MSSRNDFDDFLLSLSSPEGTNHALVIELMRRWEDFKLSRQVPTTPNFNWVVFTKDGFGFDLWSPKDWRGDSRYNWDDSVHTFEERNHAVAFIFLNKPCLSMKDVMDIVSTVSDGAKGRDTKNYLKNQLHELTKSKQGGV